MTHRRRRSWKPMDKIVIGRIKSTWFRWWIIWNRNCFERANKFFEVLWIKGTMISQRKKWSVLTTHLCSVCYQEFANMFLESFQSISKNQWLNRIPITHGLMSYVWSLFLFLPTSLIPLEKEMQRLPFLVSQLTTSNEVVFLLWMRQIFVKLRGTSALSSARKISSEAIAGFLKVLFLNAKNLLFRAFSML